MLVTILPPGIGGNQGFMIARDRPSFAFATEDANWVDFTNKYEAVQFLNAGDAIEFAEMQGWTVMNKRNSTSLVDVPMDRWL
jgi:nucleoside 2-deoxyribosyltransferase